MMASLGMCLSLRDCFGICHGFFLLECANTTLSEALSSGYFIEMPKGGGFRSAIFRDFPQLGKFWQFLATYRNFLLFCTIFPQLLSACALCVLVGALPLCEQLLYVSTCGIEGFSYDVVVQQALGMYFLFLGLYYCGASFGCAIVAFCWDGTHCWDIYILFRCMILAVSLRGKLLGSPALGTICADV